MSKPLRVLIVEDSEDDALSLVREIQQGGYAPVFERVDTAEAMSAALDKEIWDVILSDYAASGCSSAAALSLVHDKAPDIPFIFVSQTAGADTAVEALKAGANDYVTRENLSRLVPAIEREMREVGFRNEHKQRDHSTQARAADLEAILDAFPDLYFWLDQDGTILDYHAGKVSDLYVPPEQFLGRRMQDVLPPDVASLFTDALRRVISSQEAAALEYWLPMPQGPQAFEARVISVPHRQIMVIVRNITDRKQSEEALRESRNEVLRTNRELRALSQVSRAASSVFDMHALLQSVAAEVCAVTRFDACAVGLVDEERDDLYYAAASGLRSDVWRTARLPARTGLFGALFAERRPAVVRDAGEELDDTNKALAQAEGIRSGAVVPIVYGEDALGVLAIGVREQSDVTDREVQLLTAMAATVGVAIQNARIYRREHQIAAALQSSLLPQIPDSVGDFEVARLYRPALREAEVGGDFYDFFRIDRGRYAVVIGDVSGKGLSAAVWTATAKYTIRAFASEDSDPASVLRRLNDTLSHSIDPYSFITVIFGVLDPATGEFAFASAGHEPPLFYQVEARVVEALRTSGTAVGVQLGSGYSVRRVVFGPGDCLLLYTDGITEAGRDGEFYGPDRLVDAVLTCAELRSPAQLAGRIYEDVVEFTQGRTRDDVAMLAIRRRPSRNAGAAGGV